ncbi:MAG: DNA-binding domain-containing protein [Candidatus Omnitrophota bacterium]|nr:DNA-binding domain-containing protein [Candidatus Omnitrophota bacterium]
MSQPSLQELQRWMKAKIVPGDDEAPSPAEPVLNAQRGTPGEERLAVYAGGYLERTRQALADVYEAVEHIVGPRRFSELTLAYAQASPSHDYNVNARGRELAEFLTSHPLSREFLFLPDLARLEWRIAAAFHAFEKPIDPARLTGLPLAEWELARVVFQPSVGCLASAWPIRELWDARTRPVSEINIDLVNRPQRVLIFRHDTRVVCELIEEDPCRVLEALLAGRTLGDVCRELAGLDGVAPVQVSAWFAGWVSQGLVVRIF